MFSPSNPETYEITLLRHAQSVGNAAGYYQGQTDFPLNETGIQQAQALAEYWSRSTPNFDLIISSTLKRASQTAEIVAERLGVPIEFREIWIERDNGHLAGLHHSEAAERFPRPAFLNPYTPIGVIGESQWELFLRAGRALQDLLNHPPGNYLVVSHGGLLNMVLYAILGIVPQANFQGARFRFRNTAYARLNYDPKNDCWSVFRLNERAHWQSDHP